MKPGSIVNTWRPQAGLVAAVGVFTLANLFVPVPPRLIRRTEHPDF